MSDYQNILDFWFDEAGPEKWYKKSYAFDAEVRHRFEDISNQIAARLKRPPHKWENSPNSSLALIIATDQFSRNMYRDTQAAFAWDRLAIGVAERMIEKKWDFQIDQSRREFIYLPFMHSESLDHQNCCVELCDQRLNNVENLKHAIAHRDLIARFGRFPHRNEVLGRDSTPEEIEFLTDGGYAP